MSAPGHVRRVIPEGFIPGESLPGADRPLVSHEAACILNAGDKAAEIEIMIYFADREPVGPYRLTFAARLTLHLRFNELDEPAMITLDTDYASVIT